MTQTTTQTSTQIMNPIFAPSAMVLAKASMKALHAINAKVAEYVNTIDCGTGKLIIYLTYTTRSMKWKAT